MLAKMVGNKLKNDRMIDLRCFAERLQQKENFHVLDKDWNLAIKIY